jgi:PTS system, glucose subfamily, IIA component
MNIFKKFINKEQEEKIIEETEMGCIYAPIEGDVIPLSEIPDDVFSEGMMGKGCGIKPARGEVYAPFDGEIILVTNTKHAIALKSCDGIELLIHVGMDTVNMNGKGFEPLVKEGDKVKCGQFIMTFSISDIENAGYATTTAVIITNSDGYANIGVPAYGARKKSEKIIHV